MGRGYTRVKVGPASSFVRGWNTLHGRCRPALPFLPYFQVLCAISRTRNLEFRDSPGGLILTKYSMHVDFLNLSVHSPDIE